jgi:hypothetical protein
MDLGKPFGGIDMDEVGRDVSFVIEDQDDFGRMITQFKNLPDGAAARMHQLLVGPARSLNEGAQTVTGVAGNLDLLSGSLREISEILGAVGDAVNGLGEKLASSGHSVAGMLEHPV